MKRVIINKDYKKCSQLVEFIENIPSLFNEAGNTIHNERNVIKQFNIEGQSFIVKRFKRPIFIQRVIYSFFRKTKPHRAYLFARKLRKRGIETPREIAFVEIWNKGLFEDGYLVSDIDKSPDIAELSHNGDGFCKELAENFACFVVELHLKGVLHHDLNSTNVLYRIENGVYQFSLIDINRMKIYPKGVIPSKKKCLKNLNRFTGNLQLFDFVLKIYAKKRKWNIEETLNQGISLKKKFDRRRTRKKNFFKLFKSEK